MPTWRMTPVEIQLFSLDSPEQFARFLMGSEHLRQCYGTRSFDSPISAFDTATTFWREKGMSSFQN
jgi:hypothetical protein